METFVVPKGTLIGVSHWVIATDERYFKNPELFNPDRFNSINHSPNLTDGFAVFGAGAHACPGNLIAVKVVTLLIQNVLPKLRKLRKASPLIHSRPNIADRDYAIAFLAK